MTATVDLTSEDCFHAHLDAHPADAVARQAFGDWLEERGDERGPGMRALGRLGLCPDRISDGGWYFWNLTSNGRPGVSSGGRACNLGNPWWEHFYDRLHWSAYPARHEVEDAAALAFATLSPETQATILEAA